MFGISVKDPMRQVEKCDELLAIVAFLDASLCVDLTNIVVCYLGFGIDFMFHDVYWALGQDSINKDLVNVTYKIHSHKIDFYGRDLIHHKHRITWRRHVTELYLYNGFFGPNPDGRAVIPNVNIFLEKDEHHPQFTVTIVEHNKHYVIHEDGDLGFRIREALQSRFSNSITKLC